MIINCAITAWRRRMGSDHTGQPALTDIALARPVPALRNALTTAQQQTLAAEMRTADESVTYSMTVRSAPAFAAGDRVQLDGEGQWAEIVKAIEARKGAVSNRVLMVRWDA